MNHIPRLQALPDCLDILKNMFDVRQQNCVRVLPATSGLGTRLVGEDPQTATLKALPTIQIETDIWGAGESQRSKQ